MTFDLYAEARTLIAVLKARQEVIWAARFRRYMESGAIRSELVISLGWTAARYLEPGAVGEVRERADRIPQPAARLMT